MLAMKCIGGGGSAVTAVVNNSVFYKKKKKKTYLRLPPLCLIDMWSKFIGPSKTAVHR